MSKAADPALQPIGALAAAAGVSTRTVRYYEQRGLLAPAGHSPGGARRYDNSALQRLLRIRELAEILGSDLDEIGAVLAAEDRLSALRRDKERAGPAEPPQRRLVRLAAAEDINAGLRARVGDRLTRLQTMLTELDERAAHYRTLREQLITANDEQHETATVSPH